MQEIRLTVQDAVEELLMSQSTIYTWIDKGFLKVEETPAGRVIIISEEELEQIRARNLKSKRNKVSKQFVSNNTQEAPSNAGVVDAEILKNTDDLATSLNLSSNSDVLKLISDLAVKAGKFELLEDIQKQKQADADYWRDEYFKCNSDNNRLQIENAQYIRENADLKKNISDLEEQIKRLKRPFGRFFG